MSELNDRGEKTCTYMAAYGVVDGHAIANPWVRVDQAGVIVATGTGIAPTAAEDTAYDLGHRLLLPGMVNAHSHAFQRTIRGRTHTRHSQTSDPSNFWSWREAMYRAANALDPDGIYAATRDCFDEMLRAGITCVGEFHYLHHRPDGRPYDDPNTLSNQIIAAANDVGIRLVLLEVYYARAGHQRGPLPEQRRFCDGDIEAYFARVDALRRLCSDSFEVGLAPHSIRAVGLDDLTAIAEYAGRHNFVVHTHVSEQPRENVECRNEYGCTPTQLLARAGLLARPRAFTAVHAIHIDDRDLELLGQQNVCACPTTEADLGDGIVPADRYLSAGTNLCLGSDSNAVVDLIQEARLLEMHTRLVTGKRMCLLPSSGGTRIGEALMKIASTNGATALGQPKLGILAVGHPFDAVVVEPGLPTVCDDPEAAFDGLMCTGTASAVCHVYVAGRRVR